MNTRTRPQQPLGRGAGHDPPSGQKIAAAKNTDARQDIDADNTNTIDADGANGIDHGIDVLRWTLLLLVLHGSSHLILDVPLRVLCGVMLVRPGLTRNPWLWILIAGSTWTVNASNWTWIDNHKYLISYWCLVCAIACRPRSSEGGAASVLAWNGRLLVALAFFLATAWKIFANQYFDGAFLYYTSITDSRLDLITTTLGGLDQGLLNQTRLVLSTLKDFPVENAAISLPDSSRLSMVAVLMSWWTLAIEGGIALAFLFGWRFRHWLLIAFLASTYVLLPVLGFGYILAIMGFAQCGPAQKRTRLAYLGVFLVFQVSRLPWESLVTSSV